jgi:hypothetical protein
LIRKSPSQESSSEESIPKKGVISKKNTQANEKPMKKTTVKAAKTLAKRKSISNDDETDAHDKKVAKTAKKDGPVKHNAVMVVYKIDDSSDLHASFNNKSGSLSLSDLFDINQQVTKNNACIKKFQPSKLYSFYIYIFSYMLG